MKYQLGNSAILIIAPIKHFNTAFGISIVGKWVCLWHYGTRT